MKHLIILVFLLLAHLSRAQDIYTDGPLATGANVTTSDKIQFRDVSVTTGAGKVKHMTLGELVNVPGMFGSVSATELGYLDGVTSAIQTQLNAKQATLVSGTNIKTVNSTSLLGSGNLSTDLSSGPVTSSAGVSAIADGALSIAKTSGLQTALDNPPFYPDLRAKWKANTTKIIAQGAAYDLNGAVGPTVYRDESGYYHVWYVGYVDSPHAEAIIYATGKTLATLAKVGVAVDKSVSDWDSGYVSGPRVFLHDGTFYMYYFGGTGVAFEAEPAYIGVATATSPAGPWVKYGTSPILSTGASGAWDDRIVYRAFVMEDPFADGQFRLYYNGKKQSTGKEQIGYATATSPLGPWTKYASNPVLTTSTGGDHDSRIGDPVIYKSSPTEWGMIFFGQTDPADGKMFLAFSDDLDTWTKWAGNPISVTNGTSVQIRADLIINDGGQTVLVYDSNEDIYAAVIDSPVNTFAGTTPGISDSASATAMSIGSNGDVAIGTTASTSFRFQSYKSAAAHENRFINPQTTGYTAILAYEDATRYVGLYQVNSSFSSSGVNQAASVKWETGPGNTGGHIFNTLSGSAGFKFFTNSTQRFTIKPGGQLNAAATAIPNYADDTAADAALVSGDLYTTTAGGRTVFRKP